MKCPEPLLYFLNIFSFDEPNHWGVSLLSAYPSWRFVSYKTTGGRNVSDFWVFLLAWSHLAFCCSDLCSDLWIKFLVVHMSYLSERKRWDKTSHSQMLWLHLCCNFAGRTQMVPEGLQSPTPSTFTTSVNSPGSSWICSKQCQAYSFYSKSAKPSGR